MERDCFVPISSLNSTLTEIAGIPFWQGVTTLWGSAFRPQKLRAEELWPDTELISSGDHQLLHPFSLSILGLLNMLQCCRRPLWWLQWPFESEWKDGLSLFSQWQTSKQRFTLLMEKNRSCVFQTKAGQSQKSVKCSLVDITVHVSWCSSCLGSHISFPSTPQGTARRSVKPPPSSPCPHPCPPGAAGDQQPLLTDGCHATPAWAHSSMKCSISATIFLQKAVF